MTATITELPRLKLRPLAPIDIRIRAREVALALEGTGEPLRRTTGWTPYYRCRCPLCDGPMRVADEVESGIGIDCQKGCNPEKVVGDLIRRGLFICWDARRTG
jgi:hypothetical protein